jgi:hypothetical protein
MMDGNAAIPSSTSPAINSNHTSRFSIVPPLNFVANINRAKTERATRYKQTKY